MFPTTVLLLSEIPTDLVEDDAVVFSFNDRQAVRTPRARTLLAGRIVWDRAWDSGSDWLASGDVTILEVLCRQVDEIGRWQQILDAEGLTFTTRNGFIRVHPAVAQIRELEQRVVTNLGLCGFTPADRTRLGLSEVRKLSGLADLAKRRSDAIGR